jgi:ComF family protein
LINEEPKGKLLGIFLSFFKVIPTLAQYTCMLRETLFYLREYLFPIGCGGCGKALQSPESACSGLCGDCRDLFISALADEKRCCLCGKPLISEMETCLSCREKSVGGAYNDRIVKLRSLFPYMGKFKSILGAYKFGKSLGVGNFLARCLASALEDFVTVPTAALVPVPPRPGKIKAQGWDQVEYLAGRLRKISPLPVCRCLKRLPSRSQKELNREERGTNLKGRILCKRPPPETAILFDDVITTGATLNACAEALLDKGTARVYGICLFYD